MPKYYPDPICSDCAKKIDGRMPEGHICTWWEDECDVCKEVKGVTAARDWRYPYIELPKNDPRIQAQLMTQLKIQSYDKKT